MNPQSRKMVACVIYDEDELPDLLLIPQEDFTDSDREIFLKLTDPYVSHSDWSDALEDYWDMYHLKYKKYAPEYPAYSLMGERIAEVHVAYASSVIFDYRLGECKRRQAINSAAPNAADDRWQI